MRISTSMLGLVLVAELAWSVGVGVVDPKQSAVSYSAPVPVAEPTGFREWQYLVIHHSGSSAGNVAMIQAEHLRRGMENGMAYHFLIGNGSVGLGDGEVAEGRRWKYQLQGGHAHQEPLNEVGIGICLVGNFNRTTPTEAQMRALANLVLRLQRDFNIADEGIHGHGQYFGEDSDCPGRNFSWDRFWNHLDLAHEREFSPRAGPLAAGVPPPTPKAP
ncbi:MAG: peptidoglycan recognition family protein [Verrucomicrobiia bacterium]